MGVCGSKSEVKVPVTTSQSSKPVPKPPKSKGKSIEGNPVEYRSDPSLTEEEREARRKKALEAAEQRQKEIAAKGITKEGSVEYEYMLKHQRDLEKYKKQDDGKNLDWGGS